MLIFVNSIDNGYRLKLFLEQVRLLLKLLSIEVQCYVRLSFLSHLKFVEIDFYFLFNANLRNGWLDCYCRQSVIKVQCVML